MLGGVGRRGGIARRSGSLLTHRALDKKHKSIPIAGTADATTSVIELESSYQPVGGRFAAALGRLDTCLSQPAAETLVHDRFQAPAANLKS